MNSRRKIDELEVILQSARKAVPLATTQWNHIEESLGTPLPLDYRDFIDRFGGGLIDDCLIVLSPVAHNPHLSLQKETLAWLDAYRQIRAEGEELPYTLFPEPDGLLPWAYTDFGDVLFWKTKDSPDKWTVCVNATRSPNWEEFDSSMSVFIYALLSHQIRVHAFSETLFQQRVHTIV